MLNKHVYEKTLNFNFITKFLHRTRFRNLEKLIISVSKEKKGKLKIIDVGCGPAEAYKTITKLGIDFVYVGVELRKDFCDIASQRYSQFENFTIIHDSIENQFEKFTEADVIIGLESFEHIPEWLVVRTIEAISKASFMYLYITVPNEVGPAIFVKNVGSALMGYNRYKEYEWRETFFASIYELDKVKRHDSGHKGFDWRWLAQTLRQNVTIVKKTSSPADFIPKFISPSVGFICVKSESRESEVIDLGVDFGFVEKAGAWYSVDGERIGQSKDNARDYLKEHSETCQLLEEKIREKKAGVKI